MALTEPDFIERDADKITAEMIVLPRSLPPPRSSSP